jgi:hypothetical protein
VARDQRCIRAGYDGLKGRAAAGLGVVHRTAPEDAGHWTHQRTTPPTLKDDAGKAGEEPLGLPTGAGEWLQNTPARWGTVAREERHHVGEEGDNGVPGADRCPWPVATDSARSTGILWLITQVVAHTYRRETPR